MKTAPAMDIQGLLDSLDLSFEITGDTQVLISCGYFDAPTGIDDFSRSSMMARLSLGKMLDAANTASLAAQYTVLVNDLGMDCSEDACTLTSVQAEDIDTVPLEEMTGSFGVTFGVVREKTLRNRAARKIKNWLKAPGSTLSTNATGSPLTRPNQQQGLIVQRLSLVPETAGFRVKPACFGDFLRTGA
jgi:hypothetical protein